MTNKTNRITETTQHPVSETDRESIDTGKDESLSSVNDKPVTARAPQRAAPRKHVGEHIDPAAASVDDSQTLQLAISQTIAARACLYWPSRELDRELRTAASGLLKFINSLKDPTLIVN